MAYKINWRDVQPKIAHLSAVHWGGLRDWEREDDPDERNRLRAMRGFARHALQGRKTSDHHKHDTTEQVYYILEGEGEVLFGDERHRVRAGDAVYLPAGVYHQMFNDMNDDWLVHHVISQQVDGPGGSFAIRHWTDVAPVGDGRGAVRWRQLGQEGEEEIGYLRQMRGIERESVQPGGSTIERCEAFEQVVYVLENEGQLVDVDGTQRLMEGDMVHLPAGHTYRVENSGSEWISYLILSA
jgi:uncharacterized cupin superfamily protein